MAAVGCAILGKVLAVLAGYGVANLLIFGFEQISGTLWPMPAGLQPDDRAAVAAWLAGLPVTAFLFVLGAQALGCFAGGALATTVSHRKGLVPGIVVGVLVTAGGTLNLVLVHHPAWVVVGSLLMYVPFAWLGSRLVPKTVESAPA